MAVKNNFGSAEFRWNGGSAPWVVRSAIADGMERGAVVVKRTMRRFLNVPYPPASKPGQSPRKRTGNLRDSITYVLNRKTLTLLIGPSEDAEYGLYLEFGTRTIEPRPFMMKALYQESKRLLNTINRAAAIAFNKYSRKAKGRKR